ncbi:LysR family transcriptional regulator [Breoghania corrubedonensis]|uniref:LysR family transcriptional regulator n=1 Tax=Breoghania corrubedonensis TaxID=665038 RepID=A0A2T5V506_9HYPH|nr:hydrogen peroxide-inducible genes activator [Breoghania corrubedonensis]PTW58857.1 LysR family transcriptional regulator [Breoghania corrubedonensis]
MITLKQLRYFEALARHRHFGKAARACAVTQPALSMQIRELETTVGVTLVERRPSEIRLTREGREVARRAEIILSEARDLMDYGRHTASVLNGTLRLGIIPSIAPYLLPRVLPELEHKYPGLDLRLRETLTETLIDELVNGDLDVVLMALPAGHADVETRELFSDRFLLATQATPDLDERHRVAPGEIAPDRLMLLEEGHCLRDQALTYCSPLGMGRFSNFGATSLTTVMQMVAAGYGVTLLPEICTDVEVRDERIALLRFIEPQPARTIGLAWRKTSPRKHDFEALAALIAAAGQTHAGSRQRRATPGVAASEDAITVVP